jgi:hypothetical protein
LIAAQLGVIDMERIMAGQERPSTAGQPKPSQARANKR